MISEYDTEPDDEYDEVEETVQLLCFHSWRYEKETPKARKKAKKKILNPIVMRIRPS